MDGRAPGNRGSRALSRAAVGRRRLAVVAFIAILGGGCRGTAALPDPILAPGCGGNCAAFLDVEVDGLESGEGRLAWALYDSQRAFDRGGDAFRRGFRSIVAGRSVWRLEDLPLGDYALKVFHDRDQDGALDLNALGAPTEPYGFSNGARSRFGPPAWDDARFRLGPTGGRLTISVR